jgi:hypothetical protein
VPAAAWAALEFRAAVCNAAHAMLADDIAVREVIGGALAAYDGALPLGTLAMATSGPTAAHQQIGGIC